MKIVLNHEAAMTAGRQAGNLHAAVSGSRKWGIWELQAAMIAYCNAANFVDASPKATYKVTVLPNEDDDFESEQLDPLEKYRNATVDHEAVRRAKEFNDRINQAMWSHQNATFNSQQRQDYQRRKAGMANSNPIPPQSPPDEEVQHMSEGLASLFKVLFG